MSLTRVAAATMAAVVLLSACGKKDDPAKAGAGLYVRRGKSGYAKLTAAARTKILDGETRL